MIDKTKAPEIGNLLVLCPHCQASYIVDDSKKKCKRLQERKKLRTVYKKRASLVDMLPLEKGLIGVIGRLKKLKEKDFSDVSLEPKEIQQKLSKSTI